VTATARAIGDLLREWRQRRRLSQLELAAVADVSARHVCFLETGRAKPSRDMLLRLAEHLQVPLRERNVLLNAAGFSSIFTERSFADPDFDVVRKAIDMVLLGHEPFPAFAVDRHWMLVASNGGFRPFLGGIDPTLLRPPVNVLRLTLSPLGLGTRLANYQQWRSHVLDKLAGQIRASTDPMLVNLRNELLGYPLPPGPVDHLENRRPAITSTYWQMISPQSLSSSICAMSRSSANHWGAGKSFATSPDTAVSVSPASCWLLRLLRRS
jgi:transcriptional regulator with XRE-family HTH domain